jgi:hypothetical protein
MIVRLSAFILPGLLILGASPAHAAAVKATVFACKEAAVFKKAFEQPAGKANKDPKAASDTKEIRKNTDAYFKAKVATGECLQLARGQTVSVDERNGNLWCVRLSGGLDCYWTAEQLIDLYPSGSTSEQPRRTKNH